MSLFYLDASALVKRYVREPGSTWGGLQVAQHLAHQEVTLTFVSGDRQALDTATAEGLPVENPFDHTDLNSSPGREQ